MLIDGLTTRLMRRIPLALIAVVAVLSCGSCAPFSKFKAETFCAIMPDSVGLYVNNPVTQMGYPIGKITKVTPSAQSVRVEFTVANRPLPADVKAVVRSTSILADRSLEMVGNYQSGSRLVAASCISLDHSLTPKSLSDVIGSSTNFINSLNPAGSDNIGGIVNSLDQAVRGQGPNANKLLTTTSSVLDSPDVAIGDLGTITSNLAELTTTINQLEPTLKQVLTDVDTFGPQLVDVAWGADKAFEGLLPILTMVADLESQLGPQIQQTLDATSVVIRKATPRAPFYASLLNVAPRLVNGLVNIANNHEFSLRYRPPLYRLRTPDGVLQCNIMNASVPGSCANVQGTPYAVDVALLQYVLTQANR